MSTLYLNPSFTDATFRTPKARLLPAAVLCIAALLGSVAAQAQTSASTSPTVPLFAPGASYAVLNLGNSDLGRPITGLGVLGNKQLDLAYGVAVGNYMTGQNYGIEVGYTDFGSVARYGGNTKVDGINVNLIGRLPLSTSFNLLGKVGTTYSRTQVSTDAANSSLAGTERGFDWSYGIGGEFMFTPQWSATLQYAEHFVKYHATGSERVSATTLGVRYYY